MKLESIGRAKELFRSLDIGETNIEKFEMEIEKFIKGASCEFDATFHFSAHDSVSVMISKNDALKLLYRRLDIMKGARDNIVKEIKKL